MVRRRAVAAHLHARRHRHAAPEGVLAAGQVHGPPAGGPRGVQGPLKRARVVPGLSNAVMAECSFLRCGTGLEVDELNEVGVGVYDATFRDCGASVHALTNFHSVVQLLACDFGGKAPVNDGSPLSTFLVRDGEGGEALICR